MDMWQKLYRSYSQKSGPGKGRRSDVTDEGLMLRDHPEWKRVVSTLTQEELGG